MNLPESFYEEEAKRLSCLEEFPYHQAGVGELSFALKKAAGDNADFVHQIVSYFTQEWSQCPKPKDIALEAWKLAHPLQNEKPVGDPACEYCHGLGFRILEKVVRGMTVSAAEPCPCRKGDTQMPLSESV